MGDEMMECKGTTWKSEVGSPFVSAGSLCGSSQPAAWLGLGSWVSESLGTLGVSYALVVLSRAHLLSTTLVILIQSMAGSVAQPSLGMLQEDQRLQRVMRELGGTQGAGFSWSAVAKKLGGGRTGKSCRLRYIFLTSASRHCLQQHRAALAHRALAGVIGPFNPAGL